MLRPILALFLLFQVYSTVRASGVCCERQRCFSQVDTASGCKRGVFAGENTECADCSKQVPCCVHKSSREMCSMATPYQCHSYGGSAVHACESYKKCVAEEARVLHTVAQSAQPVLVQPTDTHGACCVNAQCSDDVDLGMCQESGGRFHGIGTSCGDDAVQCGGGCCHPEHGCRVVRSAEACAETYLGDGVGCSIERCGGACCRGIGGNGERCDIVSPEHCSKAKGDTFLGVGETDCERCAGACCDLGSMLCDDGVKPQQCLRAENKKFHGVGSTCDEDVETCGGACCVGENGGKCVFAESRAQCEMDLSGYYSGDGSSCDDSPCRGACCTQSKARCEDELTPSECHSGFFHGVGVKCADVGGQCGGACCTSTNQCHIAANKTLCDGRADHWAGMGVACSARACQRRPGACCLPHAANAGSACVVVQTSDACGRLGGTWHSDVHACPKDNSLCFVRPHASKIPAVQKRQRERRHVAQASNGHTDLGTPGDLIGACCSPEGGCEIQNAIDCESQGGYFRGSDSNCTQEAICEQCLPCLMGQDETNYCPLHQYSNLVDERSHSHHHHHHSDLHHHYGHSHAAHHRNDACEQPQLCASNYGRCFVQAVRRREVDSDPSRPYVCGGVDAEGLACAIQHDDVDLSRCAVGVCERDPQFPGTTFCTSLREFPCMCRCFDESARNCGSVSGTVYNDRNLDGSASEGEPGVPLVRIGIFLDNSEFSYPPQIVPLTERSTDENGEFLFDNLYETRYALVVLEVPDGYSFPAQPLYRVFEAECDASSSSSSSSSDSDDDDHHHHHHHYQGAAKRDVELSNAVNQHVKLSGVINYAHEQNDNQDFFIHRAYTASGRVLVDTNGNNVDDGVGSEPGIGGAFVRARRRTSNEIVQTVLTNAADDGRWQMSNLPQGLYDFEEIDAPGYVSTGDAQGANDNLIENIAISELANVTSLDFFDALSPSAAVDDDDNNVASPASEPDEDDGDDDDDGAAPISQQPSESDCDFIFWFLYGSCYDYVFSKRSALAILTILFFLCVCASLCSCCVYVAAADRRRRRKTKAKTSPAPSEDETEQQQQQPEGTTGIQSRVPSQRTNIFAARRY